jgi:hypothetical protein
LPSDSGLLELIAADCRPNPGSDPMCGYVKHGPL